MGGGTERDLVLLGVLAGVTAYLPEPHEEDSLCRDQCQLGTPRAQNGCSKQQHPKPIIVDIRELRSGLCGNKTHIPTPVLAGAP